MLGMTATGICLADVMPIERCDQYAGRGPFSKAFRSTTPNSGSAPDSRSPALSRQSFLSSPCGLSLECFVAEGGGAGGISSNA